jgi:hypothetical protein
LPDSWGFKTYSIRIGGWRISAETKEFPYYSWGHISRNMPPDTRSFFMASRTASVLVTGIKTATALQAKY